jgi:predicted patatin/cPLA2 family phospholipase
MISSGQYEHTPILGKSFETELPARVGLVLEGGGMRGFYSAGVLDAFAHKSILFPYISAVSAGAANALSYLSGQVARNRQVAQYYVSDPRYLSWRNWIRGGSAFDWEFVFHTIPDKLLYFDRAMLAESPAQFMVGSFDCDVGATAWFDKDEVAGDITTVVASCALPVLSKVQHYRGMRLLDGGIADPIPIIRSIKDGNEFHVVVLTRNAGYRKEPFQQKRMLRVLYRRYPKLVDAMLVRHQRYQEQLELCEELQCEGKALIVRPEKPLELSRLGTDTTKLLTLYDEGTAEGYEAIDALQETGIAQTARAQLR